MQSRICCNARPDPKCANAEWKEWLAANYPDAYWLLIYGHPMGEFSLIPLAIVFLGLLWKYEDRVQREPMFQNALALSLAIHSILVHIRIG
ncbi:MAG: hypothetical protein Q8S00_25905 [Deltaproteobacteria bacterium]|nr:hypothetical protein [Deltaproteobacteria bacterium]